MTSQEFYRLMDKALEPECQRLGLSRQRGQISLWAMELPVGTLFFEISKGSKNPYVPFVGGRFTVDCAITPCPDPKLRGVSTAISYMEYYSETDLGTLGNLQDRVLRKIVDQKPAEELDQMIFEIEASSLKKQIGTNFRRHQVFSLPYLDEEDVSAWGAFLASRLEKTVVGVRDTPAFFLRTEGDPGSESTGE